MTSIIRQIEEIIQSHERSLMRSSGWIKLDPFWPIIQAVGSQRDIQKKSYKTTKNWSNNSTHQLGIIGELVLSYHTGLPVNFDLLYEGDGNLDFDIRGKTVDVKSTQYWRDPHLKQYPNPKKWSDIYILVSIDLKMREGLLVGWASADEMKSAPLVNYGHGDQRSLPGSQLHAGLPDFFPKRF